MIKKKLLEEHKKLLDKITDEYIKKIFYIICNNVPWIDIKYCPNCGKEVLEWKDDDEK